MFLPTNYDGTHLVITGTNGGGIAVILPIVAVAMAMRWF